PVRTVELRSRDPALRVAFRRRIERTELVCAVRRADRAFRQLLGRMPVAVVAPQRELERAEARRPQVLAPAREVLEPLVELPGTVVALPFGDARQRTFRRIDGPASGEPRPAVLAALERAERRIEPV